MQTSSSPVIALTAGEPAGIGPDLCVMLAQQPLSARVVVLADHTLLEQRATQLGLPLKTVAFRPNAAAPAEPSTLEVLHHPLTVPAQPGQLNSANSRALLKTLDSAAQGCLDGQFAAMVTAPVHKGIINDAGIPFTGHTEYLAARTGAAHVVMMLVGGGLRIALATTHVSLRRVADAISGDSLTRTLRIIHQELNTRFAIQRPRILVAGLNPHAGESGHLGREELDIIEPLLNRLRATGMELIGPLPADTLFTPSYLKSADAVLVMYHDQGLPVLKYASFGHGVNITLGLPIIRTSVDHGTALTLAGTGRAQGGSLAAALAMALELTHNQARRGTR